MRGFPKILFPQSLLNSEFDVNPRCPEIKLARHTHATLPAAYQRTFFNPRRILRLDVLTTSAESDI